MRVEESQIVAALDRLEVGDRAVRAFVPEPDRQMRVLGDFNEGASQLAAGGDRPLAGVLIGVKDIISVDGLSTRAGSVLPFELFDGPEASLVGRFRRAGALIVGKTTTTEFAFSEPTSTRNPRHSDHTPGGSSSGSAAAVAAGLVGLAVGTQTVDSIVTPAAYCGVVGYKPSFGRVPLDGVLRFSPSMDHAGLLASDVKTLRSGASALCHPWRPAGTPPQPVLGVPAEVFLERADPSAVVAFSSTLEILGHAGVSTQETDVLSDIETLALSHRRLIASEFAEIHAEWFARFGERYRPKTAALFEEGRALPPSAAADGRNSGERLLAVLENTMDVLGLTAWISPAATGPAPRGLAHIGDPIMGLPWTHAHLPVVALPSGTIDGRLPIGIQLVGRFGRDEELLALAELIEGVLAAAQWSSGSS